jgi:glycerophosphoryl diester phosphodiesterase
MNLDWLTARPIAHRGLHDAAAGVIENTPGAFRAAIEADYGIETDVQVSADGEAMVHHDDELGRLTDGHMALDAMQAADIKAVNFKETADRIMTLAELLDLVRGRVPLLIEIKTKFDRDIRLIRRTVELLGSYQGPAAIMSFDPRLIEQARKLAPGVARGIVAERHYSGEEWDTMPTWGKLYMAFLGHAPRARPHFIAYSVSDLPALAPWVTRTMFGVPLLTWTVRSNADRAKAARYADQIIFEGFRP